MEPESKKSAIVHPLIWWLSPSFTSLHSYIYMMQ